MTAQIAKVLSLAAFLGQAASSPPILQLPEKELAKEKYELVTDTFRLPADVREALARQLNQKSLQMADADESFNATDVVVDRSLPGYRLIAAALGARYAVVHFEQGGIALRRWVIVFHRAEGGLNVLWHGLVDRVHRDPKDFERAIRSGSLWKAPARPAQK